MRKYFSGDPFVGYALVFSAILLGSFVRIYDLDFFSHWSDELATIYYAKYSLLSFYEETHPPGFYLLVKLLFLFFDESIFAIRLSVALSSIFLGMYVCKLAKEHFSFAGWVIFTVLLFLIPVDYAYARMARMYSPVFMLTLIFMLHSMREMPNVRILAALSFILSWLFPLGFLVGGSYLLYLLIHERKLSRHFLLILLSIVPVVSYYLARFLFFSKSGLISGYLGGENKVRGLFKDIFYTMAGDHYPKHSVQQLDEHAWLVFAVISLAGIIISTGLRYFKNRYPKSFDFHFILIISTLLFIELFSLVVINIKLGRYLIFLIPVFIIHLSFLGSRFDSSKYCFGGTTLFTLLVFYLTAVYKPFVPFSWERESFKIFQAYRSEFAIQDYVFCGNKFQFDFYFKAPHRHCMHDIEKFKKLRKDFIFIDMNGFMSHALNSASTHYKISSISVIGSSLIAKATFKQTDQSR